MKKIRKEVSFNQYTDYSGHCHFRYLQTNLRAQKFNLILPFLGVLAYEMKHIKDNRA